MAGSTFKGQQPRSAEQEIRLDPFLDFFAMGRLLKELRRRIARYKASLRFPSASPNPVQCWKEQRAVQRFSTTGGSVAAHRIFCISASSADSEHDFPSAGPTVTVTDDRSQLSASEVVGIEPVRWRHRAALLN